MKWIKMMATAVVALFIGFASVSATENSQCIGCTNGWQASEFKGSFMGEVKFGGGSIAGGVTGGSTGPGIHTDKNRAAASSIYNASAGMSVTGQLPPSGEPNANPFGVAVGYFGSIMVGGMGEAHTERRAAAGSVIATADTGGKANADFSGLGGGNISRWSGSGR